MADGSDRKMEKPILAGERLKTFQAVAGRDSGAEYGGPIVGFSIVVGLVRD